LLQLTATLFTKRQASLSRSLTNQMKPFCSPIVLTPSSPPTTRVAKNFLHEKKNVLQERGLEFSPSTGESPDGSWREEGFIIFEISLEDALGLGRNFGQHAIIYGRGNRLALAWCEDEKLDWFYPFIVD
jgi:Protein of unknown function (DUF3293)